MRYRDIYIGLDTDIILEIEKAEAFPAGADAWTWTVKIDKERTASGTPDLSHDADSAVLSNGDKTITLTFNVPNTKTDDLEAGQNIVDIESDDGAGKELAWPEARGDVSVLQPLGTV